MRNTRAALLAALLVLSACTGLEPTPSGTLPSSEGTDTTPPSATATPEPTPVPEVEVPLAVVTGYTNLKSSITAAEVDAAIAAGNLIQPCEASAAEPPPGCLPAADIAAHVRANPTGLAFLPWSLVRAEIKVLPVDGADLFGSADARSMPYPYSATASADLGWEPYDVSRIRTMISPGNMCHDRGPAHAALVLGRG